VLWLFEGYRLEFLGKQTFVPGLWMAGLVFFAANCWILGIVIADVAAMRGPGASLARRGRKKNI
jgi:GPI mannosyltransferase 1 subunit M